MSRFALTVLAFATGLTTAAASAAPEFGGATPLVWSERLAHSELARRGTTLDFGGSPKAKWDYAAALLANALQRLAARTGETTLGDAGSRMVASFVAPDGTIRTYAAGEFSLDNVAPGRVLLFCYEQTHDPVLKIAIDRLRRQLAQQPRTPEGGFWHKQRYPQQVWLDGLFMAQPFSARYGRLFGEPANLDDAARQLLLADQHLYDGRTGLLYHGWDADRKQAWADPATGRSACFWGRAEGWYAMALVDVLEELPPDHPQFAAVQAVLQRVAAGLVRWQDPASGVWWQVLDQGGREGNYLEASASSMFVYALAKGVNHGWLPRAVYQPVIARGYGGLIREFVRPEGSGAAGGGARFSLTQVCEVAGLGYTNAAGRPRDGTYAYYVGEPVVANDLKGVGAFILAGVEAESALAAAPAPTVGWDDAAAILARIRAPEFPAREFPITEFGARPGADATAAIRAAVEACHAAGGGRVIVPPGDWATGAIRLLGRVNLHLETGATLRFSPDPAAYPTVFTRWEGVECLNYSALIYALDEQDVAVTGRGTLDGQASEENWWAWTRRRADRTAPATADRAALNAMGEQGVPVDQRVFGAGHFLRPNFIQFYRCRNVLIEDVTLVRSPMWEIHPVLCANVTVRGVAVDSHGPNNDGCDPESSRDVLIEHCRFATGDDCIAIKSGRNADGRRVNAPSENLVIRGCLMQDGHGGVVLGSECTGGIRNVFVEACRMDSPNLDRALRLKDNAVRGGVLENVFMRDVTIGRVSEAVVTVDLLYEEGAAGAFPPVVRNLRLDRVTSSGSPRVLHLRGFPGAVIDGLAISDSEFDGVTQADVVQHAGTITFRNVTINSASLAPSRNSRPAN